MYTYKDVSIQDLGQNLSYDDLSFIKKLIEDACNTEKNINLNWKDYFKYTFEKALTDVDENLLKAYGKNSFSFNSLRPYVLQLMRNVIDSEASTTFDTTSPNSMDDSEYLKNEEIAQALSQKYEKILEKSYYKDIEYNVTLQAAVGGKGIFKVVAKYINEYDMEQSIFIEHVEDPTCVFFDPTSRRSSKIDAEYAVECILMDKDAFKRAFPDKEFNDFVSKDDKWIITNNNDKKQIKVCDFYYKIYNKKIIYMNKKGEIVEKKPTETLKKRIIQKPIVYIVRVTGDKLLEKPKETIFSHIPFIMVEAESYVDKNGCKHLLPVAQHGFDSARSNNYIMNFYFNHLLNNSRGTWLVPEEGATDRLMDSVRNPERGDILVYRNFSRHEEGERVELNPPQPVPPLPLPQEMLEAANIIVENIKRIYGVQFPSFDETQMSGKALYNLSQFISANNEILIQHLYQAIRDLACVVLYAIPKVAEAEEIQLLGNNKTFIFDYMYEPSRYNIVIKRGVSHKLQQEATVEIMMSLAEKSPTFAQFINTPNVIEFILENQDLNNKATLLKLWEAYNQQIQQQQTQSPQMNPLQQAQLMEMHASAQQKQASAQATMINAQTKKQELELKERDNILGHNMNNQKSQLEIFKELSQNKRAREENTLKLAELTQRGKQDILNRAERLMKGDSL